MIKYNPNNYNKDLNELKNLIERWGWKKLMLLIKLYAQEKRQQMLNLAGKDSTNIFATKAREWEIIYEKISTIRKNVKM